MQEFISSFGLLAPLVYLIIVALGPIVFLPMSFLAMLGGILFGLKLGLLLNVIGIALNCYLMFIMTRYSFKSYVENFVNKRLTEKNRQLIFDVGEDKLMLSMLILRFIPIFPYSIINYAFAMTNISLKKYMLAGVLGAIPGKIVYLNFGGASTDIFSKKFLIAALLLVAMTLLSLYASKKYKNRNKK